MKLGDLVKMKRGYSPVGIVIETKRNILREEWDDLGRWVRIMWPDCSYPNMERQSDVEVINESR
jgi:hypothetical protein